MEMVCTTNVVPRNDRNEGRSTVFASGLNTTKCIGGDGSSRAIPIALRLHARIHTGRVAAPELYVGIGNWLATRRIDHVDVEMGDSAFLTSKDV